MLGVGHEECYRSVRRWTIALLQQHDEDHCCNDLSEVLSPTMSNIRWREFRKNKSFRNHNTMVIKLMILNPLLTYSVSYSPLEVVTDSFVEKDNKSQRPIELTDLMVTTYKNSKSELPNNSLVNSYFTTFSIFFE